MKASFKGLIVAIAFVAAVFGFSSTSDAATGVVTNFKQTEAKSSSASFSWSPYTGSKDAYYKMYWGASPNALLREESSYSSTTEGVYGLDAGTIYYAQVIAYEDSNYKNPVAQSDVIEFSAALPAVEGLTQTAATNTSASLSWTPVPGAAGYIIYAFNGYATEGTPVATTIAPSAEITGLMESTAYRFYVMAFRGLNNNTFVINSEDYKTPADVKTVPTKVTTVAMTQFYSAINVAYYGWTAIDIANGYEFELTDMSGKVLYSSDETGTSVRISPFVQGVFTKARVRAYITIGLQKYYGEWSDYTYNASSKKIILKRSGKKIKLSWKKIAGTTSYGIYISTKKDSGYKKVKVVSSKKKNFTITKIGKKKLSKKKTYYVRVYYYTKINGVNVPSNIVGSGSIS